MKLKWTKRLVDLAQAPNLAWHCITQSDHEHCDVASIMYQATSWEKPRRVAIVRRLNIDPGEVLCADWLWECEAIATTFDWSGEDVWHFYNLNHIKEAKYGFAVDQFSSQNFGCQSSVARTEVVSIKRALTLQPGSAAAWGTSMDSRSISSQTVLPARYPGPSCTTVDNLLARIHTTSIHSHTSGCAIVISKLDSPG